MVQTSFSFYRFSHKRFMPALNLKPSHKVIKDYYHSLEEFDHFGVSHESAVRSAFQSLLEGCGKQRGWKLIPEDSINLARNKRIVVDGALIDKFKLPQGYWEAKDIHDDLPKEALRKFEAGYPQTNILFQTPKRAILWQNEQRVLDKDLNDPKQLIETLQTFFSYRPQEYAEWQDAVAQFKDKVPEIGRGVAKLIQEERRKNSVFSNAFENFLEKCHASINPDLSEAAVEEMLIQHLLTVRIFRTVFNNPDFTRRNVIANEIETVIDALTSQSFSRLDFLQSLDHFYVAIERTAATINNFSQKQHFLNTVYEQFFQGFSVEVADTHGIVYTPQPIVDFMVKSVEQILRSEFDTSLSDEGVHIIDPFVGTGNFIVRIMREIRRTALEDKYACELHCNEVMLLPYYVASMNIEHEFYQAMDKQYQSFKGICLTDTFEMVEMKNWDQLLLFTPENTKRVEKQKKTSMFVIIGNPPYNAGQVNENDNNKNRKYETLDQRVSGTFARDSQATNKNMLADPYVKAIRWASDRIGDQGIVAFVTNNSFLDGISFDGMRKHLYQDFNRVYVLDLKGNVRKDSMREGIPIGEKHTVFGLAAMVGIAVTFLVKNPQNQDHKIYYSDVDWRATRREKFNLIENARTFNRMQWRELKPDKNNTWLTEGLSSEFETFIPMGSKVAKAGRDDAMEVIFKHYSNGVKTNRDAWAYNFNRNTLTENMQQTIEYYNEQLLKWRQPENLNTKVDDFVVYEESKISWSRDLKLDLKRVRSAEYAERKVRDALYRPFTKANLFFDRIMNEEVYGFPAIFPTTETEIENRVICVSGLGSNKPFHALMAEIIPCLDVLEKTQCFPFYTYDEDGTNRRENITGWALHKFRSQYQDETISKWDVFHYIYAVLHHPDYRETYQANLKKELPRIPFLPDFWSFIKAGRRLADIHVSYEDQPEYRLGLKEKSGASFNWRVEKMKLSKDKTCIHYNESLTLAGIPPEAFDYRLGNRSALDWVINQYQVKTDKRSGITNDPNRDDDKQYIIKLIKKVITVSLETVKLVKELPEWPADIK